MNTAAILIIQDEKKTFHCKGYGNCRMIFTRSEHLARHERKHTGEKPFNCIVPGCSRKFSRFDNMMQHTQTHHSTNDKQVPKLIKSTLKRRKIDPIKSIKKKKEDNHMAMLLDELFSLSDSSQLTSDEEEDEEEEEEEEEKAVKSTIIRHMMTLPHLATYLLDHPDEPPENYFFKYYYRLSKQDLLYPIEYLLLTNNNQERQNNDDIYITIDEFEALQGLSRFYTCQK
ncbi:hypothetical protein EDC94DRAFT_586454 [Helicostylum pulchrum]|nr:hypothetical protein EDC94DRAFT_586454 [Helicostylum pulchrum]